MRHADEIARRIESVANDVFRIPAYDPKRPHIFAESKDEIAARLRKLAADARNAGGPAGQFRQGDVVVTGRQGRSRTVRVETRRAA